MSAPLTTSADVAAHTPGPWSATNHFADSNTSCNCGYVLSEGYAGSICVVSVGNGLPITNGGNDCPPEAEAAANARLIAAAPDMLRALQALNGGARPSNWNDADLDEAERDAWRQLDAAIAKATGLTGNWPEGE